MDFVEGFIVGGIFMLMLCLVLLHPIHASEEYPDE